MQVIDFDTPAVQATTINTSGKPCGCKAHKERMQAAQMAICRHREAIARVQKLTWFLMLVAAFLMVFFWSKKVFQ